MTYLPMPRGFLFLVAILDWHSRYVVAWAGVELYSKVVHGVS